MNLEFLHIKKDFQKIKKIWNENDFLNDISYFVSWGWIESWIQTLPANVNIKCVLVMDHGKPIASLFLGKKRIVRAKIFINRNFILNATGINKYDDPLFIEYNSILHNSQLNYSFYDLIKLLPMDWEEIYLPGLNVSTYPGNSFYREIDQSKSNHVDKLYNIIIEKEHPSYYVDLDLVRKNNYDFLSLLSSNTRYQIRRSYRALGSDNNITVESPNDINQAMEIFDQLYELHTYTWKERKIKSGFISRYSKIFHKNLIQRRFDHNEIQLLKIRSANNIIGCLYNLVYKGHIYFFQSGINYPNTTHIKPGLICHCEAVKYNLKHKEHLFYDFLAGNEQYKSSLATHKNKLIWVRIQKQLLRFKIESYLRRVIST